MERTTASTTAPTTSTVTITIAGGDPEASNNQTGSWTPAQPATQLGNVDQRPLPTRSLHFRDTTITYSGPGMNVSIGPGVRMDRATRELSLGGACYSSSVATSSSAATNAEPMEWETTSVSSNPPLSSLSDQQRYQLLEQALCRKRLPSRIVNKILNQLRGNAPWQEEIKNVLRRERFPETDIHDLLELITPFQTNQNSSVRRQFSAERNALEERQNDIIHLSTSMGLSLTPDQIEQVLIDSLEDADSRTTLRNTIMSVAERSAPLRSTLPLVNTQNRDTGGDWQFAFELQAAEYGTASGLRPAASASPAHNTPLDFSVLEAFVDTICTNDLDLDGTVTAEMKEEIYRRYCLETGDVNSRLPQIIRDVFYETARGAGVAGSRRSIGRAAVRSGDLDRRLQDRYYDVEDVDWERSFFDNNPSAQRFQTPAERTADDFSQMKSWLIRLFSRDSILYINRAIEDYQEAELPVSLGMLVNHVRTGAEGPEYPEGRPALSQGGIQICDRNCDVCQKPKSLYTIGCSHLYCEEHKDTLEYTTDRRQRKCRICPAEGVIRRLGDGSDSR